MLSLLLPLLLLLLLLLLMMMYQQTERLPSSYILQASNLNTRTPVSDRIRQLTTHQNTQTPGPGCTTTSQPVYCQGGRKSASLVLLSPDALTSQIV